MRRGGSAGCLPSPSQFRWFDGVVPETTGRPAYHPATLLKIYLYGYLNRVQSSRRLDLKAGLAAIVVIDARCRDA
jgi:hypothetical protein